MLSLRTILDGDGAWPELAGAGARVIHLGNNAPPIQVAGVSQGMTTGRPSIMIRIDLPDDRVVLVETSLRLFLACADALRVRYGDDL